MNKKQLEGLFLVIIGYCALLTLLTIKALVFRTWGEFLASLGPFLAGWYVFFITGRKLDSIDSEEKTEAVS